VPTISAHSVAARLKMSRAAREHLGRHVARRPDRDRPDRLVAADRARDAEVDEHDPGLGQDHVLRLDVAVHDLLVVHVLERLAGVARVLDRLLDRQPRVAAQLDLGAEVGAVDELHHDVEPLLVARVVDHLDHARVAEAGEQPRLDLEAGGVLDVEQPLDRHLEPGLAVERAVDGAHRPARDRRDDLVAAREQGAAGSRSLLAVRRLRQGGPGPAGPGREACP
jgi:hypothetical protein